MNAGEQMDLVTAMRLLLWEDRRGVSQPHLQQALVVTYEAMDQIVSRWKNLDHGDVLHDIIMRICDRQAPLPTACPATDEAARAYLKRMVENLVRSWVRKPRPEVPLEEGGYAAPDKEDVTHPEEAPPSGELPDVPVTEQNWVEVLDGVLAALGEVLSRLERHANDEEWREVVRLRVPLESAVRAAAQNMRVGGPHVFVRRFLRLMRCWSGRSTVDEEVQREARANGQPPPSKGTLGYRRMRNYLDVQNRRTLRAVHDHLVAEGVPEALAMRLVKALSIRLGRVIH